MLSIVLYKLALRRCALSQGQKEKTMSEKRYHDRVVQRNDRTGKVDVWHKNRAGCTTKQGHLTHHQNPKMTTNHWGKKIH
jgi:hypothetical protein